MNQLKITPALIKNLEAILGAAKIGIGHVNKELKTMPEDSVKSICENINEEAQMAYVAIQDFIYRATHDEYGEKIK